MKQKILIIEDDEIMRVTLGDSLNANGYAAYAYEKGRDGVTALNKDRFSLVITDVRLPDMTGIDVLKEIKEKDAEIPVIIMTAFGSIKDAVWAMKLGAFDYITKPFSLEEFTLIVKRALEVKEFRDDDRKLRKERSGCVKYQDMIGESAEMRKIHELIKSVSRTDSTILILGENGTGKELVASAIHYQSSRKTGSLVKVNCAAIPEHLVESELFGYEKGAFTGAAKKKPGRFERAQKGTIFLDEIGDLPASVQMKLLRVLQDGSYERLGGTETLHVNVRIIAATNRKLWDDVSEGRFREDLYYRLNVIPVYMPALRDRREDIPLLIDHFLACYNRNFSKSMAFSTDAVRSLMEYDFPGNVRELENIVERCVALSKNNVIAKDVLPSHIAKREKDQSSTSTLSAASAEAEREHIIKILRSTRGNRTKAAEILGISRKTLWEKVKAYDIE
jgi:two-component system response regulator AtoC